MRVGLARSLDPRTRSGIMAVMKRIVLVVVSVATALIGIAAQHDDQQHAGPIPDEGLGRAHMDISCSPAVGADFDRALALLHNFWYSRAFERFTEVAAREPGCAMAYWGAAMTYNHPFWDPPSQADEAAAWAHRMMRSKNSLMRTDAEQVELGFQLKLSTFMTAGPKVPDTKRGTRQRRVRNQQRAINKTILALPVPRRVRDRAHVKSVAKQPCLVCGRRPADAHHLRFAQLAALGRKVSDEFTVPLCREHHRAVHRSGDEAIWWHKAGIDPTLTARALWLQTHPLPADSDKMPIEEVVAKNSDLGVGDGRQFPNTETKPIEKAASSQ